MSEERSETESPGSEGESPQVQEQAIREETSDMESTAGRMDERLDQLGDDIKDAKQTARQRQDAPDEPPVAGDWEGEATGADQGDDATDTVQADNEASRDDTDASVSTDDGDADGDDTDSDGDADRANDAS